MRLKHLYSIARYLIKSPIAGDPIRCNITLTNKCNLRCLKCNAWRRTPKPKELTTKEVKNIIDQFATMGVTIFYLFGGEPLIRKDLFELVNYIKRNYDGYTETVTNGTLLNEHIANKIVKSGLDKIAVSLDGLEDIHDKERGVKGTFRRAITGLKNIQEAKKRLKSKTPLIEIAFTVSRLNYNTIKDLIDYLKDYDLFEIRIRHMGVFLREDIKNIEQLFNTDLSGEKAPFFSTGKDILLTPKETAKLQKTLPKIRKKGLSYGMKMNIEPALFKVNDWSIGRKVTTCIHLWTCVFIDPYGKVFSCGWIDGYSVGDLRKNTFKEIWNNETYQHIRKNIKKVSACSKCCYFNLTLFDNIKAAITKRRDMFTSLLKKK